MSNLTFSMPTGLEMEQLINFCKVMASAPFYSKIGPGGVMAIYLTAKERNLPFMACLNGGLHTFDGKVTFSAVMINSLIIQAGHSVEILYLDDTKCVLNFKRGDKKDPKYTGFKYEYNIEMAQKAGYLRKDNWKNNPRDMLFSRCVTGGGRKHIPEIFIGVLATGELVGDDSDGSIPESLPPNVSVPELPKENNNAPLQLEHKKVDGYDEFCKQHDLFGENNRKLLYIQETCKKANMPEIKVINHAVKNEDLFLEKYLVWENKNFPNEKKPEENS